MDGFRFCTLLRGESRILFQNLPIFLIFEQAPLEDEMPRVHATDVDGHILATDSIQRLLNTLGPAVEADSIPGGGAKVPLLVSGLRTELVQRIRRAVSRDTTSGKPCSGRSRAALSCPQSRHWVRSRQPLALALNLGAALMELHAKTQKRPSARGAH